MDLFSDNADVGRSTPLVYARLAHAQFRGLDSLDDIIHMTTMTPLELAQHIRGLESRGATMVTLSAMTDAHARKTGNEFGRIEKLSTINGVLNYRYSNAAAKVGQHEVQPRAWGSRWSHSIVEYRDSLYLSVLVNRSITHPLYYVQRNGMTVSIPAAQVAHLLPMRHERLPMVRDYRIDHIKQIRVNGERIRVTT